MKIIYKEKVNNVEKNLENLFFSLSKSKFRSRFHLKEKDKEYVLDKGMEKVKSHAYDFVRKRISGDVIENDGKQTPMRGHPVFIAQHACACCCRGCLEKWHKIPKGRKLTESEIDYIVNVIMKYIEKEVN